MAIMMGNSASILVKGIVIGLLNLPSVPGYTAQAIAPPEGPYISLHVFPDLADIRTISAVTTSVASTMSKRLPTYQRPSHFNLTDSNRIPAHSRANQKQKGDGQQGSWQW